MVEFKGDASAINQVLKGLHVVDIHPTKIYCKCCIDNVERIEFLNASFVPEQICEMLTNDGYCTCSKCNEEFYIHDGYDPWENKFTYSYCPNCGAKVIG